MSCIAYALAGDSAAVVAVPGDVFVALRVDPSYSPPTELDAGVLEIRSDADGRRSRSFRDSIAELHQTDWANWPVLGPRMARWCARFIAEHDLHPKSRYTKWKAEARLNMQDGGVATHELIMRVLELAICYDQLQIGELACFELLLRQAQLSEWRHRDRALGSRGQEEGYEDEFCSTTF